MRKHRFYIAETLSVHSTINLDADLSHYIGRVLRLNAGDNIYLFNNTNCEFTAVIKIITRNAITVEILEQRHDTTNSINITLAQVLAKGDKMDFIIQKATELGVSNIVPLFSQRAVIRNVAERAENKLEHWQKIAIAACCQSWRNNIPQIEHPQNLSDWLATCTSGCKLILSPGLTAQRLKELESNQNFIILIGPEGGFTAEEVLIATQHEFIPINLGPRILRAETAGIACMAALQAMFGDG